MRPDRVLRRSKVASTGWRQRGQAGPGSIYCRAGCVFIHLEEYPPSLRKCRRLPLSAVSPHRALACMPSCAINQRRKPNICAATSLHHPSGHC